MSIVSGISEASAPTDMVSKLKENNLSQESFMTLLLAQLKMQSPMNPFDSTTMMQQVSQLTNLASTQGLEKSIAELSANLGASQVLQASELIGKHVQVASGRSPLTEENGLHGSVIVPEGVNKIAVTIKDENDLTVKTINLDALSDGVLDFSWNGRDELNNLKKPGSYKIEASATINGENTALSTGGNYKVNSVALDRVGNGVIINVDGLGGVGMDEIIKIT